MSYFKGILAALMGEPLTVEVEKIVEKVVEKEVPVEVVKEAIGKASGVMLYHFTRKTGKKVVSKHKRDAYEHWETTMRGLPRGYDRENPYKDWRTAMDDEYETVACHTCEQAHAEADGERVMAIPAIRVGNQYFLIAEAKPIKVLPKPKVAK